MKTIIYVDGFNLYYGALKGTPYKWLDLHKLLSQILSAHNEIVAIKYFTARVSGTKSDPNKADHQDAYLRALQYTTPCLKIHFGQFTTHVVKAKLVTAINGVRYADVFRTNEKGSDVNLAAHLLNDAWLGVYDCAVMVSGDSDLVEPIRLVKTFKSQKKVGLLAMGSRPTSKDLGKHVDFVRRISSSALKESQFPRVIEGTNIQRPEDW